MIKVLIAGETWINITTHIKGFDSFQTSVYKEGIEFIRTALEKNGCEVTHIPNHSASRDFPDTKERLSEYDVVILSDIGSNNLLLSQSVFTDGLQKSNKLNLIHDFVYKEGKALIMVGGYMSFAGYDGKARYNQTVLADIVPIQMLDIDNRVEHPEGCLPVVRSGQKNHPVLSDITGTWPLLLGYNKTIEDNSKGLTLVDVGSDPLIAIGEFGKGRSAVFTSDCAPHWCTKEFIQWDGYEKIWKNLVNWLVKKV